MSTAIGHVLVVGDVMEDIIVRPEGPLVRGSDRRAKVRRRHGGSAANQAMWLASLGVPVTFLARVGADDHESLVERFSAAGVTPAFIADPDLPTGVLVTILDAEGEHSFLTDRGANLALRPDDAGEGLLDGVDLLLVSGYAYFADSPRRTVRALTGAVTARGIPFAVDPASVGFLEEVGPGRFLEWTEGAAIVFANEAEAASLTGTTSLRAQMAALGACYERVIVKRGVAGAVLGGADGVRLALPAPSAESIDTTGAGDAFAAGFIAAERAGLSENEALERAIAIGTEAIRRLGGQPDADDAH